MQASSLSPRRYFRLLLLIVATAVTSSAFSGTYILQSMTGGTAAWTDGGGPGGRGSGSSYTYPYVQSQGSSSYSHSDVNILSLTYSGTITAKFVWVPNPNLPNDLPPTQVITVEKTSAVLNTGVGGPGVPLASYYINDGIDPAQSGTGMPSISLAGIRVLPAVGGQAITVCCAPKVQVSDTKAFIIPSSSVNYSVDILYPTLSVSGLSSDILTGNKLAEPIGQGNTAMVSILAVFNSVSGAVSTVSWDVDNGDACAGFTVADDMSTGIFNPYVPPTSPTTHWYYYKGAPINGGAIQKAVTADVTITALGTQVDCVLTRDFYVYGPNVNPEAQFLDGLISCYADVSTVIEFSGTGGEPGIMLYDPSQTPSNCNIGTNTSSMPFAFDYDSVQLINCSSYFVITTGTSGNWCLDNSYPYGIAPYYDSPQFGHRAIPGLTDSANFFFQWSGVCCPLTDDFIYVTCAHGDWQWTQNNSFPWGNATGAVIDGGVVDGLVEPLQWSFLYKNSGKG